MRRPLLALLALALSLAGAGVAPSPALADHVDAPDRVTLMGSLMDELGCGADWDETCDATDMEQEGTTWTLVRQVPAGSYEFKVRHDGSWDNNFGLEGKSNGDNSPLVLQAPAALRFSYDQTSHVTTVTPAQAAPGLTEGDRRRAGTSLRKDLTDERFYFVMADRFANGTTANDQGGLTGGRLETGFDPTAKGFYHGGDLQGLEEQLDYIEGLGTTAIWMTPSFKNKPVQGAAGSESAAYHGYWITDFTQIDPHLGTNDDLKSLIDAAHERGIKVFFDIITNHTADVLDYEDSAYAANGAVPYVSKEEEPYRDSAGEPFDDSDYALGTNGFPDVDLSSFPYTPVFQDEADRTAKTPSWLNDPTMYHNRGTSTFAGEDSMYGDFPSGNRSALDDLWTERPRVLRGMIDIYKTWVRDAGVDGFRIDTVKHVNMEFWKRFAPALTGYASSIGNDDFFMFGEVYDADPRFMSRYTTTGKIQATVDFGFQANGVNFAKSRPTQQLAQFYEADDYYTDADSNAYSAPTFLGNHDMGRVGKFIADGGYTGRELLKRDRLAHSLMYLTRGQPVVYYGDEQGFVGDGGDQDARQDMFASQVATYNDDDLIGAGDSTARDNYDTNHPLYRHLAALSALRDEHPALADGAQQTRYASDTEGVFAFSRTDAEDQVEHLVAINNSTERQTVVLDTYSAGMRFDRIWPRAGQGTRTTDEAGQVRVIVPPLSAKVWRAAAPIAADDVAPAPTFTLAPGATVGDRAELRVDVPGEGLNQVTLAWRPVGKPGWRVLGTDDNAPYRVFHDVTEMAKGSLVEYRAIVRDADGDLGVTTTSAVVGTPPPPAVDEGAVGPVEQPGAVSVPGSHGSEAGCAVGSSNAGGDWEPACDEVQLTLDPTDQIWKATLDLPAGTYEFKAAINRAWDENYGDGGRLNGSNIPYEHAGGSITFSYDHRTHHVSNTSMSDVLVLTGDFQSEVGCTEGDGQPDCMATWLQDRDGDGTYVFRTATIPAGTYDVQVARNGELIGDTTSFTVGADGAVTRFSYDAAAGELQVTTEV